MKTIARTSSPTNAKNERSNRGSAQANGPTIRKFRMLVGLTQIELAERMECSERLIRKMEKGGFVDAKNLANLQAFFEIQGFQVEVVDLIVEPLAAESVARQWFIEKFMKRSPTADAKWLDRAVVLDEASLRRFSALEQCNDFVIQKSACSERDVAIWFRAFDHQHDSEFMGTIWVGVNGNKIAEIQF